MSFFSSLGGSLGKIASAGGSLLKSATKIPGIGMLPIVGNVLSAAGAAASVYEAVSAFGPKESLAAPGGGGLPALPGGGLPALPGGKGQTASMALAMPGGGTSLKTVHINPAFPQDKATLDSWIAAGLLVPYNQLHSAYRAPKGFRVVHVNGVTMAVRSDVARRMKLVKPTHKPPISVGEWHALKKAHRTVKKVHKVHGLIKYVTDHTTVHGQVKIAHHKKTHHKKAA